MPRFNHKLLSITKFLFFKISKNAYNKGATAIEYALIVALVAIVCITAFNMLGKAIQQKIEGVASTITGTGAEAGSSGTAGSGSSASTPPAQA